MAAYEKRAAGCARAYVSKSHLSLQEREPWTRNVDVVYNKRAVLGEGAYGKVWLGQHKITGEQVALKRLLLRKGDDYLVSTLREIQVGASVQHVNVMQHIDVLRGAISHNRSR